jgi:hypothetical protein
MMPVIAHALLESIRVLAAACRVFEQKCVRGIKANVEVCRRYAEMTGQLVTAIAPVVGYDRAAELFKKAVARDVPIRQILEDERVLPKEDIDRILDPRTSRGAGARARAAGEAPRAALRPCSARPDASSTSAPAVFGGRGAPEEKTVDGKGRNKISCSTSAR